MVKYIKSSLWQLAWGCVLLPIVCWLLWLISGDWANSVITFLVGLFSEVPFIGLATDAIETLLTSAGSEVDRLNLISTLVNPQATAAASAISIGLLSGSCFKFGKLIGLKGIPILPSLAAVPLCGVLSWTLDIYADMTYIILTLAFFGVLNTVLTLITAEKKGMAFFLGIGCELVAGIFMAAYAALLIMVAQGMIRDFWLWMGLQLCLVIPAVLFMAIDAMFC